MSTHFVYHEITGFRVERVEVPPPVFPPLCSCCRAKVLRDEYPGTRWVRREYQCGGTYEPKPQIQNHTEIWWGSCPKGRMAAFVKLDVSVPAPILNDALEEQGWLERYKAPEILMQYHAMVFRQRSCADCDQNNYGHFTRADCGCGEWVKIGSYKTLAIARLVAARAASLSGNRRLGKNSGNWNVETDADGVVAWGDTKVKVKT